MRRLLYPLALLPLVAAAVFVAAPPRATTAAPDGPKPSEQDFPHFVVFPYLQFATADSVRVCWETSVPGPSVVRYGVGSPDKIAEGAKDVTFHEVKLDGLEPGRNYVYQVSSDAGRGKGMTSPLLTFRGATAPGQAFSFALIGDTQKNPSVTAKVADHIFRKRPDFVVHLGDVVDNGPDKREWVNELFEPCKELFARVPVYPCIGNHEKNHAHYYRYFSLPDPKYYYTFSYGDAQFFVIDSNKPLGPESEQYKWLDATLAASKAKWKFVYHHHPAYSSDEDDYGNTWKGAASKMGDLNARSLVALHEKHRVDIVFNGHVHTYERTWPIRAGRVDRKDGVVYLTSGGGGGRLENPGPLPTWFKAQVKSDYHFCTIAIHEGRLSLRAYDVQGVLFDVMEMDKK